MFLRLIIRRNTTITFLFVSQKYEQTNKQTNKTADKSKNIVKNKPNYGSETELLLPLQPVFREQSKKSPAYRGFFYWFILFS